MADTPSFQAEFTQAIQVFPTPPAPPGFPPSTFSVPLISDKQTLVRVYLHAQSTRDPALGRRTFDGKLHVLGPKGWETFPSLNGPIQAHRLVSRAELDETLNFLVPALLCKGRLDGMVVLQDSFSRDDVAYLIRKDFIDVPPLPFHAVLVRYDGPDFFGQRVDKQAGGLDLLTSLDYLLRCMPLSGFTLDGCDFLHWQPSEPADRSAPEIVEQSWHDLSAKLGDMRSASDTDAVYLGVLPTEASCAGTCGLGGGGVALFRSFETENAAHEVGHAIGRPHAPCANHAPDEDPSYPDYFGRPRGSIGEFGVDLRSMTLFNPWTTFDFMTYCSPRWTSPYDYMRRLESIKNWSPSSTGPEASSASLRVQVYQFVSLRVRPTVDGHKVEVLNNFAVERHSRPSLPECSDVNLELIDRANHIVARVPGDLRGRCGMSGEHRDYAFWFPSRPDVTRFRILSGQVVLAEHAIAKGPPKTRSFRVEPAEDRGRRIALSWECEPVAEHQELLFSVRFSVDGRAWRCLATGLKDRTFVVDTALLPGGEACQLQLLATGGFRTAEKRITNLVVEKKTVRAFISEPKPGSAYRADQPLYLCGAGFAPGRGISRPEDVLWTTPLVGCLGRGYQVTHKGLPPGSHLITLHVSDGEGSETCASVRIEVQGPVDCKPASSQDRDDLIQARCREADVMLQEEPAPVEPAHVGTLVVPAGFEPRGAGGRPCECGGSS